MTPNERYAELAERIRNRCSDDNDNAMSVDDQPIPVIRCGHARELCDAIDGLLAEVARLEFDRANVRAMLRDVQQRRDALSDALRAKEQECEALRKDAERYRWLRKPSGNWHWTLRVMTRVVAEMPEGGYLPTEPEVMSGNDLDVAIDAALANQPAEKC